MTDCNQFICFYDRGNDNFGDAEDRVPIGAGSTREEAIADGLPATLAISAQGGFWQLMVGYAVTVAQPDIKAEDWPELVQTIRATRDKVLDL